MDNPKEVSDGLILEIRVKPNSNKTDMYRRGDLYFIEIQSPPTASKANMEMIKFFKKFFNRSVHILAGLKSKNKIILIENLGKKDFEHKIPNL